MMKRQSTRTMRLLIPMVALLAFAACGKLQDDSGKTDVGTEQPVPVPEPAPGSDTVELWVDLGLPSGRLWASCNVGASRPEEFGGYFAWGEVAVKEYYDFSTYCLCRGDYTSLVKYCNNAAYGYDGYTDTLTVLQPEDDIAALVYGEGARIPTLQDWQELHTGTSITLTNRGGVRGYLFTGSNGNSIFLPFSGLRYEDWQHGNTGQMAYYWSGSLYQEAAHSAWAFYMPTCDKGLLTEENRSVGITVRAVR